MAHKFVPEAAEICEKSLKKFISLVGSLENLLVVSGAGFSTESGIPDYRSKDVGLYARISHKPIYYQEFMTSAQCRQRFWSRSFLTWPTFGLAVPNINHHALAKWEKSRRFLWLITQNVDGLHLRAGSRKVTELHGNALSVNCTNCYYTESRQAYQERMEALNPDFHQQFSDAAQVVPDGDLVLPSGTENGFKIPECPCCGGVMKTAVTFFGENVSMDKLQFGHEKVEECDGVLCLGTSLVVSTGSRFVHHANQLGKPIFIVNIGPTEADHLATMKLDFKISDVLKEM